MRAEPKDLTNSNDKKCCLSDRPVPINWVKLHSKYIEIMAILEILSGESKTTKYIYCKAVRSLIWTIGPNGRLCMTLTLDINQKVNTSTRANVRRSIPWCQLSSCVCPGS